jgi:type II secretory pathway pseudopilin PulG
MNSKLIRYSTVSFSVLLLAASVGVVYWITRDEQARLAERERQAIEAAERAYRAEQEQLDQQRTSASDEVGPILHDIDTLLGRLSGDDLPTENE